MRDINHHTSGTEPAMSEGEEREGCYRQTGTFWFSPWGNTLAKNMAGFAVCLPTWCHGSAPRITASNCLHTALPQQTKLLPPSLASHCCGWICRDNVPVPLLALPHACWQGSMSSGGTTVSPLGNWAACTRWPTPPSLRAPEGHLQPFTAQ